MVLDAGSKQLVDGVVGEDDILKENITSMPQNEDHSGSKRLSKGQISSRSKREDQ